MRNCRVRKKYVNSTYFGTDFYAPFTGKHDPCTGYTLGTGLVWVWYVLFPYQVRTFRTILKYPLNCGKSIGTLGQHLYSKGVPNTNPQEHQKFAPWDVKCQNQQVVCIMLRPGITQKPFPDVSGMFCRVHTCNLSIPEQAWHFVSKPSFNPECEVSTSRFTIQQHIHDKSFICEPFVEPVFGVVAFELNDWPLNLRCCSHTKGISKGYVHGWADALKKAARSPLNFGWKQISELP